MPNNEFVKLPWL